MNILKCTISIYT